LKYRFIHHISKKNLWIRLIKKCFNWQYNYQHKSIFNW